MSDEKTKNEKRAVEWTFDFGSVTDSLQNMLDSFSGEEAELTQSEFSASSAGVQSAQIEIGYALGRGSLKALEKGSDTLMKAAIMHLGEVQFNEEGDAQKSIQLTQKGRMTFSRNPFKQGLQALAKREELVWDIELSPDVPLSLNVDAGVGPSTIDLTGLLLTDLSIDAGVGTLDVTLPNQAARLDVDLDGGVGQSRIELPENADMSLHIDGGVGLIEVLVPANSAIRIDVDGGVGSVKIPDTLERKEKRGFGDNGGIWKSSGFELAERRIEIHFKGGVGQFILREVE